MFKTRLKYLLMRSFDYAVKQWREDPEGLKVEINAHLKRASEYRPQITMIPYGTPLPASSPFS